MELNGKVTIITGGGRGIGAELARRFALLGAQVIVVDRDLQPATEIATEMGGIPLQVDVSQESEVQQLIQFAVQRFGRIDLFCANAGVMQEGGIEATNAEWQRAWDINFMSHVYTARAVIPIMLKQGEGYLLHTASAAGLLTQLGAVPYSVTKHAVVAFAEWLAITYHRQGIRVSCLCPQGVHTQMLDESHSALADMLRPTALTTSQVADSVVEGLRNEQFLILPHPEVATYYQNRAGDNARWLRGMRRWWNTVSPLTEQAQEGAKG